MFTDWRKGLMLSDELSLDELVVISFLYSQLFMRAYLNNLSTFRQEDSICIRHCWRFKSDHDDRGLVLSLIEANF